ncbi:MAG: acyl-CoA dehydrogenase [Planctomycetota bacterium]
MDPSPILTPVDAELDVLCEEVAAACAGLEKPPATQSVPTNAALWPARQLAWCGERGVFRWSASRDVGGFGWSDADQLRGYLRLGQACLTTAFVLTQRTAASTRLAESANLELRDRLLPDLLAGRTFATVAISQLTTSRRHLGTAALRASESADGYRFSGYSPWVTGAAFADWLAVGAVLDDGRQLLAAVPACRPGITIDPPHELVALDASHTGSVRFEDVAVRRNWVVAGPCDQVLRTARSGGSGGLQTSALALALAARAIGYLEAEADRRGDLAAVARTLRDEWRTARSRLLAEAGDPVETQQAPVSSTCNHSVGAASMTGAESLRAWANDLALRASQAALVAAKGTGFVAGHPAGRWCREALFFLVWS